MKSKKIYLVRHGQTDFNLRGIVQGSGVDSSLNDMGRQQAQAFFDKYQNIRFDKIYTSKLKRSVESVSKFIDLDIPYEQLSGLNEISWGNREGVEITPGEDAYYHGVVASWQRGETHLAIEEGESPEEVFERQKEAMAHILSKKDEETILICMHGRAMRILLCQLLNYPLKSMDLFEHHNLGLYLLDYTGSMFTVEKFNDTSHFT